VNGQKVIELTCAEVVPLIAQSGAQLDLVVSRRPADTQLTDSLAASTAGAGAASKQFHVVVDDAVAGHTLDSKNMKEDDV